MKDVKPFIFEPNRRVLNALSVIENRATSTTPSILHGLPGGEPKDELVPWRPGDLIGILGFTSHGKTSFVNYIMDQHAHYIRGRQRSGQDYPHIVLRVTWENSIEETTAVDLSRVTQISLKKIFTGDLTPDEMLSLNSAGADEVKSLPVWLLGHSLKDDELKPPMDMAAVRDAIVYIEQEKKMVIDLVILDYLQRITPPPGKDLREGYMSIVNDAKNLSLRRPVILNCQAKRDVVFRDDPQPMISDGQETSNFEQSCTHVISVMMPKHVWKEGHGCYNYFNDTTYYTYKKLLSVMVLKQTMGDAPMRWYFEMGFGGTYLSEVPAEHWEKGKPKNDKKL